MKVEWSTLAGQAVKSLSLHVLAADGPCSVRKVLLDQWDFSLHRQFYILQVSLRATIGGHSRQDPRTPLLVHHTARAVNRINDEAPQCLGFRKPARQHDLSSLKPFSDEQEGSSGGHLVFKELD